MKKEVIDIVLESKVQPREDARKDQGIGTSRLASIGYENYDNLDDPNDNAIGVEIIIIQRGLIKGEHQQFCNAQHFRIAIKDYCIAHNHDYIFKKNDSTKIIVKYPMERCPWHVYAAESKREGTFSIRKCNLMHTCDNGLNIRSHPKVTFSWIAEKVKTKLRSMPRYRPIKIVVDIHENYGMLLKYYQAWHGKEMIMHEIHGLDHLLYDKLEPCCRALKLANLGTISDYDIFDDTRRFHHIFISLGACIMRFHAGCRPMIFMDGTYIKHKYQRCLLSATAKDANNGIFTITFAIVQQENDES
ncbi:uncharacterized protein [Elaeis guineensis]|uniref:uncharacterized protein n=1 Tax=Elaeis guineensis var. tenera TaxID=51953 RepID=UPI003C6D3A4F